MLPGISTDQMIEVDRIMMEDFSIPVELMMEHAGVNLAKLVVQNYQSAGIGGLILVVAGSGNNGAGGITAARKLIGWGYHVVIFLPKTRDKLRITAKEQLHRLESITDVIVFEDLEELVQIRSKNEIAVMVDSYIGYGFNGVPDKVSTQVFELLEVHPNVISLDAPSGLNTSTGVNFGNVKPKATLTLAFPKTGMMQKQYLESSEDLGKLFLADIGVPQIVYESMIGIDWNEEYTKQRILDRVYEMFTVTSFISVQLCEESGIIGWSPKE